MDRSPGDSRKRYRGARRRYQLERLQQFWRPPTPTINARLELKRYTDPEHINYDTEDYAPLSFDRPEPINHIPEDVAITDPIAGRAAGHVAPAEWRFLGWLERENFAYDLNSETQLHFDQLDLDQYKVLITTTHPEYWSRKMY